MRDWVWPRGTRKERRVKLATLLFGHLTVRYTRLKVYSDFKGDKNILPYEVLGADSDSVAIVCESSWQEERRIYHIHFDGKDRYWIALDEQHREWFKRIKIA